MPRKTVAEDIMGSRIQCFMLEPTATAELSLRRYVSNREPAPDSCPLHPGKWSYHNTSTGPLETVALPIDGHNVRGGFGDAKRDDPRWPTACGRGYVFKPEDQWQDNLSRIWRRTDTGELTITDRAPAGAMWWFSEGEHGWSGPDGRTLYLMLPPGGSATRVWLIDGPARNSEHPWQRTGVPPLVVARPSIAWGEPGEPGYYHGWLGGPGGNEPGWLVEC